MKDFCRRDTHTNSGEPVWESWDEVAEFCANPVRNDPNRGNHRGLVPEEHVPESDKLETTEPPAAEALYANLVREDNSWVLAFDIDADDIAAQRHRKPDDDRQDKTILAENGVGERPPLSEGDNTFQYTYQDIQQALTSAHELRDWAHTSLDAEQTAVYYSGQGAHLYIIDTQIAQTYTSSTREAIAKRIINNLNIPIDKRVTYSNNRVLRVPYSIHADVSRIVAPAPDPDFPFQTHDSTIPEVISHE